MRGGADSDGDAALLELGLGIRAARFSGFSDGDLLSGDGDVAVGLRWRVGCWGGGRVVISGCALA